jgi:hypothetical protein
MLEIYKAVAARFVERINEVFASEESMEAEFKKNFEYLDFTRTDHWAAIIYKLLRDSWIEAGPATKVEPTSFDKLVILKWAHPLLDYNLFSQVLLNLQGYTGMAYAVADAEKELEQLKFGWSKTAKHDPFAPHAKMIRKPTLAEDIAYNNTLSNVRSLNLIANFSPQTSWRVSPKGSTPAFADSRNISMIGIGGDKYLKTLPSLQAFYIVWDQVPQMAFPIRTAKVGDKPGVVFHAPDIPYEFISKSGGEVLHEVLFARKLMYEIYGSIDSTKEICIMVPRMYSVLVVTEKHGDSLTRAFNSLKERYPMISLITGDRAAAMMAAAEKAKEQADGL